jgi:hypothetical protein
MKFRFVLLGPDDDPESHPSIIDAVGDTSNSSPTPSYRRTPGGFVRIQKLGSGKMKQTPVTNFTARIVRDLLISDGQHCDVNLKSKPS